MRNMIIEAGRDPAFYGIFWANSVDGVDTSEHCLACLIGKRHKEVNPDLINFGGKATLNIGSSDFVYAVSYTHLTLPTKA